jgi:hypothetical protein
MELRRTERAIVAIGIVVCSAAAAPSFAQPSQAVRPPLLFKFKLDPQKVVVTSEVKNPDLSRVDEVGLVTLAPGGGHGVAGSANLSTWSCSRGQCLGKAPEFS